ncbi:MAG: peptide deformylase [Brevibacillus sp.]|nr:peptide deformylase [Brevibacillus sp.]
MAERTIRKLGDPILRARCKAVQSITPHVCKLLDDMAETLYAGPNRAGLAAPQIGIPKRLIVMDCGEGPTVPVRFETQHLRLSEVLKPLQRVLIRFYQYRITRQVNLELNHRLLPICSIAMLGRIEEADHDEMFAGKGWPSK